MNYRFLPVLISTILVAGCGANTGVQSAPSSAAADQTMPSASSTTTAAANSANNSVSVAGVTASGSLDKEPVISIADNAADITELQIVDQVVGTGDLVQPTSTVLANYVGIGLSTGQKFDSSWDRGEPIAFGLNQVIQGWSEGLVGMQVGGRRLLVIPAELAYSDSPPPGSGILPGETLIFVVDLVDFE